MIKIKNQEDIKKMRQAGRLAARVLEYIESYVKDGVSTSELDKLCHDFIIERGATPAPLNYHGFPKSVCISVNNVVCHGIPSSEEILKNGDIVNIDVTVILNGFHGDTSKTFMVGKVSKEAKLLVNRTREATYKGIEVIKPGIYLYEVGRTIQNFVEQFGYSVVRDYGGHGIGIGFHEEPNVFHFYTKENKIKLKSGMVFTVEPMINNSPYYQVTTSEDDGWTVYTEDNSLSAQFEHTVLVTDSGYEILTKTDNE